jgi:hypothetical protein
MLSTTSLKKKIPSSLTSLAALLALVTNPSHAASVLVLEAEAGTGDGSSVARNNASAGQTRHLVTGESAMMSFSLAFPGSVDTVVRYSNDNFGPLENVQVLIDGIPMGSFLAQDTGDFGAGWNVFVDDSSLPTSGQLTAGSHQLSLAISGGDGFGVEIDNVTLSVIPEPASSLLVGCALMGLVLRRRRYWKEF